MSVLTFTKGIISTTSKFAKTNASTILIVQSAISSVGAVVLAIKSTPKALAIIKAEEEAKQRKLTKTEVVKCCGKCYIPTAVSLAVSLGCGIGSNCISLKNTKNLSLALIAANEAEKTASEAARNWYKEYQTYKESVKEVVGDETEKQIKEKTISKWIDNHSGNLPSEYTASALPEGKWWCYELYSGQYYIANENDVEYALMNVEKDLNRGFDVSYNTFLYYLNQYTFDKDLKTIKRGDSFGWKAEDFNFFGKTCGGIELIRGNATKDNGRIPCLAFDFSPEPDDF